MTWEQSQRRLEQFRRLVGERGDGRAWLVVLLTAYGHALAAWPFLAWLGVGVVIAAFCTGVEGKQAWMAMLPLAGVYLLFLTILWRMTNPAMVAKFRPTGRVVAEDECPPLHELVEAVAREVGCGPGWTIHLTTTFGGEVGSYPRWLGLRSPTRVLSLGYPLLCCLGTGETKALVAHEMHHMAAHLSRCRLYLRRVQIVAAMNAVALERGPLLERQIGRLNASVAENLGLLDRAISVGDEFEADAAAARLSTPRYAASCLVALACRGGELEKKIWEPLFLAARADALVTEGLFARIREMMEGPTDPELALKGLEGELNLIREPWDTHPTLRERLAALSFAEEADPGSPEGLVAGLRAMVQGLTAPGPAARLLPPAKREDPASMLLGPQAREEIERDLEKVWREENEFELTFHRLMGESDGKRLAEVARRSSAAACPELDAVELARVAFAEGRHHEAVQHVAPYIGHPVLGAIASWATGMSMLELGDEGGLEHLRRARDADIEMAESTSGRAHGFLSLRGRHEEAARWVAEFEALAPKIEAHDRELRKINHRTAFEPMDLSLLNVEGMKDALRSRKHVRRAWVLQRGLAARPQPLRAMILDVSRPWFCSLEWHLKLASELQDELMDACPGAEIRVVAARGDDLPWKGRAKKTKGSLFYDARAERRARRP